MLDDCPVPSSSTTTTTTNYVLEENKIINNKKNNFLLLHIWSRAIVYYWSLICHSISIKSFSEKKQTKNLSSERIKTKSGLSLSIQGAKIIIA